ncbi:MAG TPA: methyltransferase dimerization domain-containing protein [Steroidobacteraceae bacterium]|nr:methyltransferase dimerization domain-containing protein [Steroidobacteraceae bacterium]
MTPERIVLMARGLSAAATLLAALEIELFTELGKGPRSYRQLRRSLGLREPAAADFLDALVALYLIGREGSAADAIYINTRESGQFLDRNSPAYIGEQLHAANARFAPVWKTLTAALRAQPGTTPPA